jgi:hypothetical protein
MEPNGVLRGEHGINSPDFKCEGMPSLNYQQCNSCGHAQTADEASA